MKKIALLFLSACFALTSCTKKDTAGTSAANPMADSMKTAYMAMMHSFETGDGSDLDKYVSAEVKDHQEMPGYEGLEGMKKMVKDFKAAYPDSKYNVEDMRVDGDILVARVRMSGTNTGSMMGMPATGKKVSDLMFIDWVRWSNGKFVEHWGVGEEMKMMEQLGLMPPIGAPAADSAKKAM